MSNLEFKQYHKPALESGLYTINVTQEIKHTSKIKSDNNFTSGLQFYIGGERFTIQPQEVEAVFPPPESSGDHSMVLPHIIITRSTLPWERSGGTDAKSADLPWLALLVFHENDQVSSSMIQINDEVKTNLGIASESSAEPQAENEFINLITIERSLFDRIAPRPDELHLLTHVRIRDGAETAVVVANRLPQQAGRTTVHLVSLENRYANGKFRPDENIVCLVSLKSWSFNCQGKQGTFKKLLKGLSRDTLRLSDNLYLSAGNVALPHYFRQGGRTVSWYRSPLVPGTSVAGNITAFLPARSADSLLLCSTDTGLFDVSYAAAWELGRLLALSDQAFALALYNWKKDNIRQAKVDNQRVSYQFNNLLSNGGTTTTTNTTTAANVTAIQNWFADLNRLKGIPLNYLVPNDQMLPEQSIRFFQVDQGWVECLKDGAFSIGRVTANESEADRGLKSRVCGTPKVLSGFILRSEVVASWPNLQVKGYNIVSTADQKLDLPEENIVPLVRTERILDNLLLCLFEAEIKTVDIYLEAESMHFGLDQKADGNGYEKVLRYLSGEQPVDPQNEGMLVEAIPYRGAEDEATNAQDGIIDISKMMQRIVSKYEPEQIIGETAENFAFQMLEGAIRVRFIKNEALETVN